MENIYLIIQVAIALIIVNVWLFRFGRPTSWRGGHARNMVEEFEVYGLSNRFMVTVGALKLLFAGLLLAGVWLPDLTAPAAVGLAALMLGAVIMHLKVRDPLMKAVPAFSVLICCLLVGYVN